MKPSDSILDVPRVAVILPAAGRGLRMGGERKQFRKLGDKPVWVQTAGLFVNRPEVHHVVLAAPADYVQAFADQIHSLELSKTQVVAGGPTRQSSVAGALAVVSDDADLVLVHDAVRPFVDAGRIRNVIESIQVYGAAALAIAVNDTVRRGEEGRFQETIPREHLYRMQTPQGARLDWFRKAHARAKAQAWEATDDVALLQWAGYPVYIVEGSERNIKITTAEDWVLAQILWTVQNK